MSRERVVILQDAIMPYRKPFYDALAAYYDVCVVHSGLPSVTPGDRYCEEIVPCSRFGSLNLQSVRPALMRNTPAKAVIAIFDLRWPLTLLGARGARARRRLLWGHRYSHRRLANALRDFIMRRFDGVIQYGDEDTAQMIARGLSADRIYLAPNTVDVPNHADCSDAPKRSLLYVGRFQYRKRLDELLQAFADVCDRIPSGTMLELVGDGNIRSDLERLAERLGVRDRVVFHGAISDPVVLKEIFAPAYAYVSPDNVGLGVLHAFAYGVPVITGAPRGSRIAGYRHGPEFWNLCDGKNAIVFPDADGLRDALVSVTNDRALAQRLGASAYECYVAERSIARMVDGFRQAIEGKPAATASAVKA